MGNTITTNPQMKESIKEAYSSDKQLFDKILEKSRAIYSKNKSQISDNDFYQKLVITYSNQLYKLPLEKIETIYNQLEGQPPVKNELKQHLDLSLKYDGLEEEKFIINQFTGKLVDNFKNKKIPTEVERNGILLKLPDLYYIHNRVLLLLDGIQQREENKLEKQIGGVYFSPLVFTNNGEIPQNDLKYIRNPNSNNKINKNNKSGGGILNNNNEINNYNGNMGNIGNMGNNGNMGNMGNNVNMGNNGNMGNGANKEKRRLNITKSKKTQNKNNKNGNKLSSIEKQLEQIEKESHVLVPPEQPVQPKKNNIQTPSQNKTQTPPKSHPIVIPEEDNLCIDPTLPCKITKREMCVKIVMNLMIRNNIILAIVSTIPIPNKNGDYDGSITFERLTSLKKGRFCAPSPLFHIQDEDDETRIQKILKFINMMDDEVCKKSGGVIFELNEKQMKDMLADETFGKNYFEYGNKINKIYQESIIALLSILEKLESNYTMSTEELNQISTSVKNTIDELYIKTQLNFLLAVMVVLDFDFKKNSVKDIRIEQRKIQISKGTFQKTAT
jgi:hypothetical protein